VLESLLGYVGDVVTTVPQVLRSQMRRAVTPGPLCAAAVPGDLRSRAEHLQTQVWMRNVAMLVSIVLVIASFLLNAGSEWKFHESVILAMTIGWVGATWRSYAGRGRSTFVPASLSWNELRAFHRREHRRQMNLQWREFVYWSVPASVFPNGQRTRVVTSAPILLAAGTQTQAPGVNLIAPNTKYQERWNQLDLSAKKTFRFGTKEFQGQFAVFNVTNGNVVLQEVQTTSAVSGLSPTLGQPQNFLQARMMRLALLVNF